MCVTFLVCAVIGYIIPIDKLFNSGDEIVFAGAGSLGSSGNQPMMTEVVVDEEDDVPVVVDETEPVQPVEEVATPSEPVADVTPVIESAIVLDRSSKNYKKVGLDCIVKASVPSGDNLLFLLSEVGSDTPAYKSNNGQFYDVKPVDSGEYTLVVKNERTGTEVSRGVKGFNKVKRLSASELQAMLNADSQDRLFYFHFDLAKLKIECTGVDAADAPQTLGALLENRPAFGWTVQVIGTPQYDDYNRITYFKVNLSV